LPTYGYRCPKCSTEFEVWQTMRDLPAAECPSCGAAANRMFFPAGIVFKGSGFYKTDSRGASSSSITSESGDSGSSGKDSGKGSANGSTATPKSDTAKSDSSTSTSSSDKPTAAKKAASTDSAR
jgi:putative FmdB family regulatory protein